MCEEANWGYMNAGIMNEVTAEQRSHPMLR
jgi:hypothetical protein